jgi:site-specific DNA-methyltransferase (adenine-specific)
MKNKPVIIGNATLYLGDCLDVLKTLSDNSVDSIVTDPPYGLSFMGKKWDYDVPATEVWAECLRVLKPGGHLLAFAGTRTQHRMAVRIEDAGFEIRDMIAWCYGSGFPKSLDVSKQIDQQEKNIWVKISKAIDNASISEIAELWINSKNANAAGLSFRRKQTEAGLNTQKNGFAHGSVLLQASHKNCDALAVIAELSSTEARPTSEGNCSSAQPNAESIITALKSRAITAENSPENREATPRMVDFSALHSAWGWQGESKADKLKAVEALKIWLGSKPSSRQDATSALCAALTDDLKLITLSQSKIFLSFDTTRQMACASVISATITESTAASLISFTADTLKSKAIDKAAGAEREVIGIREFADGSCARRTAGAVGVPGSGEAGQAVITAPATESARQWQGWGTALKPALEPITVARKPLCGTVAANVLQHGTGALNIDGCRVAAEDENPSIARRAAAAISGNCGTDMHSANRIKRGLPGFNKDISRYVAGTPGEALGRWPANLIHDGSPEVVAIFPDTGLSSGGLTAGVGSKKNASCWSFGDALGAGAGGYGDTGSAARFFYTAKASSEDRDAGVAGVGALRDGGRESRPRANTHPTVKPTDLMRYLVRLVTPPGGTVLDPFNGSGSTGKACMLEGLNYIGCELDPAYIEISRARIEYAIALRASGADKLKPASERDAHTADLFAGAA